VSRLTDLIDEAKAKDAEFGAKLEREFQKLASRLPFGLNFERHSPEAVELPLRPIRRCDKVRVLPPRGTTHKGDQRLWEVLKIRRDGSRKVAELVELQLTDEDGNKPQTPPQRQTAALDDLKPKTG